LLLKNQSFAKLFRYFCVRSSGEWEENLREQEKKWNTKTGPMSVPEQRQWSGCLWFAIQQLPGLLASSIVIPLQRHWGSYIQVKVFLNQQKIGTY
jgi:hypothetical protein